MHHTVTTSYQLMIPNVSQISVNISFVTIIIDKTVRGYNQAFYLKQEY